MKTAAVFFASACLPLREIAAVDEHRLDAEARQDLGQDELAGAEQRVGRDDAIAGLDQAHERGEDRGHAGRRAARGFGAFEQCHALLEHLHGRIAEARIDEARLLELAKAASASSAEP